jgi:hypothetical protein
MSQKVVCQLVGAFIDLAICESALSGSWARGFNDTLPVWKPLRIGFEYLMDSYVDG